MVVLGEGITNGVKYFLDDSDIGAAQVPNSPRLNCLANEPFLQ
jgi:hypothetical protein